MTRKRNTLRFPQKKTNFELFSNRHAHTSSPLASAAVDWQMARPHTEITAQLGNFWVMQTRTACHMNNSVTHSGLHLQYSIFIIVFSDSRFSTTSAHIAEWVQYSAYSIRERCTFILVYCFVWKVQTKQRGHSCSTLMPTVEAATEPNRFLCKEERRRGRGQTLMLFCYTSHLWLWNTGMPSKLTRGGKKAGLFCTMWTSRGVVLLTIKWDLCLKGASHTLS